MSNGYFLNNWSTLPQVSMWIFDTQMHISFQLVWGNYLFMFIHRIPPSRNKLLDKLAWYVHVKRIWILMFIPNVQIEKTLIPLSNWYVEMDMHAHHLKQPQKCLSHDPTLTNTLSIGKPILTPSCDSFTNEPQQVTKVEIGDTHFKVKSKERSLGFFGWKGNEFID